MNCKEVNEILFLFVDNEMEEEMIRPFRDHMAECPGCNQTLMYTRRLLLVMRERCVRCTAPRTLRQRILTSFPHRKSDQPPL